MLLFLCDYGCAAEGRLRVDYDLCIYKSETLRYHPYHDLHITIIIIIVVVIIVIIVIIISLSQASCKAVTRALENLPNHVIPSESVRCLLFPDYNAIDPEDDPTHLPDHPFYGVKYTLVFTKNPGKLKELELNFHLDGKRATLYSSEPYPTLGSFIYSDGYTGEFTEYFKSKCRGVDVRIEFASTGVPFGGEPDTGYYYFAGLTNIESRQLARCLGESDGDPSTSSASGRVEGNSYDWDYGDIYNPHIVKLVDKSENGTTDLCPGSFESIRGGLNVSCPYSEDHPSGFYVPVYFNYNVSRFIIMTRAGADYSPGTTFSVFTTTATAQMVSDQVRYVRYGVTYINICVCVCVCLCACVYVYVYVYVQF
jgi:hypothetical protein